MSNVEGSEKGCGCGCGSRCCGGKIIKALILLLVGGIIGYLLGSHCAFKANCPMTGHMGGMSAPATPAPAHK